MTRARSGLADPPPTLAGFPEAPASAELHRLSEFPGAWWYSSVDRSDEPERRSESVGAQGGGRFDLDQPRGTCYTAESLAGCVVEQLLRMPVKVVVAERLDELFHTVATVRRMPPTADLTSRRATGFGLNAEIHTTLNYEVPRRWARAFDRDGFRGLRYRARGDVSQRLASVALFGSAGLHRRAPSGMTSEVCPVDRDRVEAILADLGVTVRPIPRSVPIVAPPRLGQLRPTRQRTERRGR
jgi:RES domain